MGSLGEGAVIDGQSAVNWMRGRNVLLGILYLPPNPDALYTSSKLEMAQRLKISLDQTKLEISLLI